MSDQLQPDQPASNETAPPVLQAAWRASETLFGVSRLALELAPFVQPDGQVTQAALMCALVQLQSEMESLRGAVLETAKLTDRNHYNAPKAN